MKIEVFHTVAGYGDMSEENLEIVPASVNVAGTGRLFEAYELNIGASPDIEDEGGTGRMFEPWEYSNQAGENEWANIFPEVEL